MAGDLNRSMSIKWGGFEDFGDEIMTDNGENGRSMFRVEPFVSNTYFNHKGIHQYTW